MAQTERVIDASVDDVFRVLADGWTYSDWVVGTAHVSRVDRDWPGPGSRIAVRTGGWPLMKTGATEVVACEPPTRLVLRPKLWPLGELAVEFTLRPEDGERTRVTLRETPTDGPLRTVRTKLDDLVLHLRNEESLRRLSDIAVRRRPREPAAR